MAAAAALGVGFRPAANGDVDYLRDLYAASRADELAVTGWPDAAKMAFLHGQFAAQHHHYQQHYDGAAWLVVLRHDVPTGRLYLAEWAAEIRIVDILLAAAARGQGISNAILIDLAAYGGAQGKPLSIHVERNNPARRLYLRHGFAPVADVGAYELMRRPVSAS